MIQTPTDTLRHHPDTPQIGVFKYQRALEEKAISELARLLYIFTNSFGINTSPGTLRLYPDTLLRHNPDTVRHKRFYAMQGTGIKDSVMY